MTTEAYMDAILDRLIGAGASADWHAYYRSSGRPVPNDLQALLQLDPAEWECDFALMWPVLPLSHRDARFVDAHRHLAFAQPEYMAGLEEAYYRRQEREIDTRDWETP